MNNIIIYRDRLIPKSEYAFMTRQYIGFHRLKPHWVGCHREPYLLDPSINATILGGEGTLGSIRRVVFKQFGIISGVQELMALNPALIHAQFGRGGALALPIAKHLNIPLAVTFHGGDAYKDKNYKKRIIPTIMQRRWKNLIDYASCFICVSDGLKSKLIERGVPASKLTTIYIGADEAPTLVSPKLSSYLLFAGRFVEKKGIFVLIDAIRQLRALGIETPLVFAGDGPLLASARRQSQNISNVHFTGWLSEREMRTKIVGACAVIIPSIIASGGDAEGLPSVAMEALVSSVPIIASHSSGVDEILKAYGAGLIIPDGDSSALTQAMLSVVTDETLRTLMAGKAGVVGKSMFSATKQSRLLEDKLLSVLL